jgi:hypothetical protein
MELNKVTHHSGALIVHDLKVVIKLTTFLQGWHPQTHLKGFVISHRPHGQTVKLEDEAVRLAGENKKQGELMPIL